MLKLKHHHTNPSSNTEVLVDYKYIDDYLNISFEVITDIESNTDSSFNIAGFDNMSLWNFDVVEVFVRRVDSHEYLEVELSPLNQKLALKIYEPRVRHELVGLSELSNFSSQYTENGFKASIILFASDIPGGEGHIEGNFFCCLGQNEERSYFAAKINSEETPNFHKPELFMRLN